MVTELADAHTKKMQPVVTVKKDRGNGGDDFQSWTLEIWHSEAPNPMVKTDRKGKLRDLKIKGVY